MKLICNKAKICKETNGRCPHLKIHGDFGECDKKALEAYGWPNGVGCYYYPDAECVEILTSQRRGNEQL